MLDIPSKVGNPGGGQLLNMALLVKNDPCAEPILELILRRPLNFATAVITFPTGCRPVELPIQDIYL